MNEGAAAVTRWLAELVPDPGAPRRVVVLGFVQALGTGVFLASSAIYFTTVVGLSPTEVGVGLSVAGLVGFLAAVPAGRLADRHGPRDLLAISYLVLSVLFVAYLFVGGLVAFVLVACLIALFETAGSPLRSALAFALFGPGAVRVRAQMRSAFNLGFSLGAASAAGAIAVGTRPAYVAVLVVDAVAQAVCVVVTLRLPSTPPAPRSTDGRAGRQTSALRDVRFVAVALLSGALELYQPIMTVAVPLWIVTWTAAPAALNSALLVLNTVAVVAFQVAAGRGAGTAVGGARLLRRSGLWMAVACLVYATSTWGGPVFASVALLAGAALLVVGELAQSAGGYALSFELPPAGRQGAYQGVFALGRGFQQFVGPALVTVLTIRLGALGWVVLSGVFVLLALLGTPVRRYAERCERGDGDVSTGRGL